MRKAVVTFDGYIQVGPKELCRWKPQYKVTGVDCFPDGAIVDFDTLFKLHIPTPNHLTLFEWLRAEAFRKLNTLHKVNELLKKNKVDIERSWGENNG